MGAGIAQLGCLGGLETWLHDPVTDALAAGKARVENGLATGVARDMWSESKVDAARKRLHLADRLEDLAACEFAIEAAPEDLTLKRGLFADLAAACGPGAILATNTSSLSVTAIAAGLERPERVCGMHFFNPPPLMRLLGIGPRGETAPPPLPAAAPGAPARGRGARPAPA